MAFRRELEGLSPFLKGRTEEIISFDGIKLLTVGVDRLTQWYRPGLLCIGDAAHTMSPVGGVGINLAIQDAVAAANILADPLRAGNVTTQIWCAFRNGARCPRGVRNGFRCRSRIT